MIGRWVRARGAELGRWLDNVTVVSMSWLANDIAPVGQMVHGALQARPVDARVWAVVAFAARFDACPVTVALTETLLECAIPYFEVRVDEASDNATFVAAAQRTRATAEERSRFEAVPIGRQRFESHAGGLFQANVPGHL
jgi:hypothetical protein